MKLKKLKIEYRSECRVHHGDNPFYVGEFADAKISLTKKLIQEIIAGCTRTEFANLKEEVNETEMTIPDLKKALIVINSLNSKIGKKLKVMGSDGYPTKNGVIINARLKDGASVEDLIRVIRIKASQWLGTNFEKYLRPSTLFRKSKFANYINEVMK